MQHSALVGLACVAMACIACLAITTSNGAARRTELFTCVPQLYTCSIEALFCCWCFWGIALSSWASDAPMCGFTPQY